MVDFNSDKAKLIALDFSRYFGFLETDFGMSIIEEIQPDKGAGNYVRILENNSVQVQLAGDQQYFYTILRRLVNGEPQPYSDQSNNITSDDLAIFLTNHSYNHFDYYVPSAGWENVLKNTAKLLNEGKDFFSGKWINTEKIRSLKERAFEKQFGFSPSKDPDLFSVIKVKSTEILRKKGYKLTFDSSNLPPYDSKSLTRIIYFEKEGRSFKIQQRDWRDFPTIYFIEIDGRRELELNTSDMKLNVAVDLLINKIDTLS